MKCRWCGVEGGVFAAYSFFFVHTPVVLCTECRKIFAPEGWRIPLSEEEAQQYCKESWEGIQ